MGFLLSSGFQYFHSHLSFFLILPHELLVIYLYSHLSLFCCLLAYLPTYLPAYLWRAPTPQSTQTFKANPPLPSGSSIHALVEVSCKFWRILAEKKKIGSKQRIQKSHEKYPRGLTSRALWHELSGIGCETRVFFSLAEFPKTCRIPSTWYYYCIPMVCGLVLIQSG
jgi:hypothetical protein